VSNSLENKDFQHFVARMLVPLKWGVGATFVTIVVGVITSFNLNDWSWFSRFGHTRDLRDRFLNGWFRWFFETNTQFEIFAQPTLITPRKQPLE
jgi:hypothetical protein